MEEGLSPSITKKLLIVTLVLIGVVLLVGEEDDPGLLTETAQTAEMENAEPGAFAYGSDPSPAYAEEEAEDDYIIEEYTEDGVDTAESDGVSADDGEVQPLSEEEFLMDDTQGFDPQPMMDVEPAY